MTNNTVISFRHRQKNGHWRLDRQRRQTARQGSRQVGKQPSRQKDKQNGFRKPKEDSRKMKSVETTLHSVGDVPTSRDGETT